MAAQKSKAASAPAKPDASQGYLIFYNAISLLGWTALLGRVLHIALSQGVTQVFQHTEQFAQVVQSLALLEILHSLVGIVRAPIMTTAMQVASRLFVLFGVVAFYGQHTLRGRSIGGFRLAKEAVGIEEYGAEYNQLAFALMLVAWSIADSTRYAYFLFLLRKGPSGVPSWLVWARYNFFFVLYPVGISCECWLTARTVPFALKSLPLYAYGLIGVLVIYVPGSYILFTHMMAQRRRIMRGKKKVGN